MTWVARTPLCFLLPISGPPHAHHLSTDACRLFPNRLYLATIASLVCNRFYTSNKLCNTTSNTKVNRLRGDEAKVHVSPRARISHDANQTRETVWVVYRFGREDEVVWSARALQIKRIPCAGKEAKANSVVVQRRSECV